MHIDIESIQNYQIAMDQKPKSKKIGKFIVDMSSLLGKGAFASTYKAYIDKNNGIPYACKIIDKRSLVREGNSADYFIKRVKQEFKALQTLKHENLVRFQDFQESKNNLYMFFQYCDSDLQAYISQHRLQKKDKEEVIRFAKQIVAGCSYFTEKGFIHRDIKPANILLKAGVIKIADFGLARLIENDDQTNSVTYAGTPYYMAPEIIRLSPQLMTEIIGSKSTLKEIKKCDVWSVGVTLYELSSGYLPFGMEKGDLSEKRILQKIGKGQIGDMEGNKQMEELVKRMLVEDVEKRADFAEAEKIIFRWKLNNQEI